MHRNGIFHRDIKPSNLMLTPDGTLKLMDFGIAKVAGEQKMTQVNKIVGTIEFMAPELIEGKEASIASDIYSMGATLYELVSGRLPFESDTDFNLMQAILKKKPVAPDKMNEAVPKKLSDIILKAMDKNPGSRYPDARSFQQALINAFPAYRDINMNVLQPVTMVSYGTSAAGAETRPNQDMYDSQSMETRVEHTAVPGLNNWKEKLDDFLSSKRNKALLALLLLFLVVAVIFLTRSGKDDKQELLAGRDTTKPVDNVPGGSGTSPETTGPTAVNEPPLEEIVAPVPLDIPKQVKEEKKQPAEKEEKPSRKKEVETVRPADPEPVEKPAPKQEEKRDVTISSPRVEVSLVLRTDPDMNQKQKQAQRVTFTVSRPVVYNGVTIINQGAVATGSITIGRVITDIEINNVQASNGRQIPLKSAKAHGKRADVESDRSYITYLIPGTRISF